MKNILLFTALFIATFLSAQTTQKDTITTLPAVTIIGNHVKKLPGSGEHLGQKTLQKFNQADINKVLRTIAGVNVRDEEGFGLRPNIGLRGTPVNRSAKITLMEDGVLMAPAPYADPSAYYFPTFMRMQSVEVLKGSSQIKYGPYTVGGAINLVSTTIPNTFKGFAQVSYGSFATNQQRIWIGDSKKNIGYVFEANRYASNGFKELDNGGNTGFDRRDFMGKLRWNTSEKAAIKQSVTLKFLNTTEDANETYLGLTYNDYINNPLRRYAATQKDHLNLSHHHATLQHTLFPAKGLSLNTTAYYTNTFRDWARANSISGQNVTNIISNPTLYNTQYQIMTGALNGSIAYQSAERYYFTKGLQTNAQYEFKTNAITHHIELGFRYHIDQANRYATQSTYSMNNGNMVLTSAGIKGNSENQIRNATSRALYLNYNFEYKNLTVSPGIRYENLHFDFSNYGTSDPERLGTALRTANNKLSVFLPGIGVNYSINALMSVFGGVHKGFSPPGMPSVTSSLQAKPETAINYELGYRFHNQKFSTQVVGFLNNYSNILGSDNVSGGGAGTGDMFNAGRAKIQGLELSATYDIFIDKNRTNIKIPIQLSYTYTNAKFDETFVNGGGDWGSGTIKKGDVIPFITPSMCTASIGIETKKFDVTLTNRIIGITRTKPGQNDTVIPSDYAPYNDVNAIEGYFTADVSANYRLNQNITAFCILTNVTNNQSIVANLPQGYRPGMPFGANLGLKINF